MWELGVDPLVVPNGLAVEAVSAPDPDASAAFSNLIGGRLALTKVGRWDPDKRRLLAIDAIAELRRQGHRPVLIARGGVEAHGSEVLASATANGLHVVERAAVRPVSRGCSNVSATSATRTSSACAAR